MQRSGQLGPNDLPIALSDFALIPRLEERLHDLADLAEPEDWDYKNTIHQSERPVLRNYLRYTYSRLREEGKISVSLDKQMACFNTGLVTPNQ